MKGVKEMLNKLFEKEIITAEEMETIEESGLVEKTENNGSSSNYPECDWYSVYMADGKEHQVYIKRC